MLKIIFFVLSTIVALLAALYFRLGAYKPVELEVAELQEFHVLYKKHTGAYHKIVPVIEDVEKWAKANGESCTESFGEFLDDPENVDEDRLRSHGGCITSKLWSEGLPAGFESRTFAKHRYLTARFEGAPSLGPLKVYPKAKEWFKEQGQDQQGPIIEIYRVVDSNNVFTRYLFPLRTSDSK